jgi:germination protein M
MKNSNKIEKGFLFSSKVPQSIIIIAILIIIITLITLFASGCSTESFTGNSNIGQTSEDTSIAAESTSNTESVSSEESSTNQETSAISEETGSNNSNEEITINVYYSDQNGEYLIGEARILSGSSRYVDAISEMMKEPIDSSLVKLIPESTKINSVTVTDGIAKVDLSKNFVDDRFISDSTDILLIYSIVNTLTEFPDVNSVEFYIDGTRLDVLGQLDLQGPLFRRSDLIKKD